MLAQKNISHIVVGKDLALATGARSALSAGQIGVYKNGSTTATTSALSAGDRFKVVYKDVSGNIVESPFIDFSQVTARAEAYTAPTEQLTYVGYNGTSGSIAINNSDVYSIYLTRKDGTTTFGEHPLFKLAAVYESDASATEQEIADALLANLVKNFSVEKTKSYLSIDVGRICDATVTASNDLVNDATVVTQTNTISSAATAQVDTITLTGTSGTATVAAAGGLSKTATFDTDLQTTAANFVSTNAAAYAAEGITLTTTSTGASDGKLVFTAAVAGTAFTNPTITNATGDLAGTVANTQANVKAFQYAAGSTAIVAGDYIRVGSVAGGTALTSSVYKVTAVSGTTGTATITLDANVVEASGTYAASTSDIEVIPAATAANAATNWGLYFKGRALKFDAGKFKYSKVVFDVTTNEAFGSTLVTTSTEATKGNGSYQEVAEVEWLLRGNRGETFRVADYPVTYTANAISGKTYDTIVIDYTNDNARDIQGKVYSFASIIIATEDESSATAFTDLQTVLGI